MQPAVVELLVFWLFLGAAIRTLPLSIQRHIPFEGCGFVWFESECQDDGFACYSLMVI